MPTTCSSASVVRSADHATITAVAFDHDGTLVNSIPAVVAATNATLEEIGCAPVSRAAVMSGMPLPTGPRLGFHANITDPLAQAKLAERFYYHAHRIAPTACELYPGVADLLVALRARGMTLAVVSNNEGVLIRKILGNLGVLQHFAAVLGEEDMPAPKPDPRGLAQILTTLVGDVRHGIFVGDSHPDSYAAQAANVRSFGVTWGIHPRAEMVDFGFDALIDTPTELLTHLNT